MGTLTSLLDYLKSGIDDMPEKYAGTGGVPDMCESDFCP